MDTRFVLDTRLVLETRDSIKTRDLDPWLVLWTRLLFETQFVLDVLR